MKKYILFQIEKYYPVGGLSDITEDFDDLEEAKKYATAHPKDYNEIVDRDTWEEVWSSQR